LPVGVTPDLRVSGGFSRVKLHSSSGGRDKERSASVLSRDVQRAWVEGSVRGKIAPWEVFRRGVGKLLDFFYVRGAVVLC